MGFLILGILGFALLWWIYKWSSKPNPEYERKKKLESSFSAFYADCVKYGITTWENVTDPGRRQRVEQIARGNGIDPNNLEEGRDIFERLAEKDRQAKAEVSANLRKLDEQKKKRYLEFAYCRGVDKTLKMIDNEIYLIRNELANISYTAPVKTSDGMINAGLAAGIGGAAPAVASLNATARRNEQISGMNSAIHAANMASLEAEIRKQKLIEKYEKLKHEMSIKCVEEPTEDDAVEALFKKLVFSKVTCDVTESGSVEITGLVSAEGVKISVDGKEKNAFIDGSLIAEIYDGGEKLDEAVVVLPIMGTSRSTFYNPEEDKLQNNDKKLRLIKGIALFVSEGKAKGSKYTVKFKPRELWIVES